MKAHVRFRSSMGQMLGLNWALTFNEFKRNLISFLIPFPVLVAAILIQGTLPHRQFLGNTIYVIAGLAILAMTYGLQCFSNDSDKKTLDFIISRPIPPTLILSVKYLVSLVVLLFWYISFITLLKINLESLPLPKGIGLEWITLLILLIHALGLMAGLLSKGLERVFVVIVTTLTITSASYFVWDQVFALITANYYWFDVPPYQLYFIQTVLPYYLTLISLSIPIVGSLWYLRNRVPFSVFRPGKITVYIWSFTLILLGVSNLLFSPVLWPQKTVKSADWHPEAGIVTAAPINPRYEFRHLDLNKKIKFGLYLSHPGSRPRTIYTGFNLLYPHFSPDGSKLLFSEAGHLKMMTMSNHKVVTLGSGLIGSWSQDGQKIIYNRPAGPDGLSETYQVDLKGHQNRKLLSKSIKIANLIWNSPKNELYIFGYDQKIWVINLKSMKETSYSFEDSDKVRNIFGVNHPSAYYDPETDSLAFGYIMEGTIKIYLFSLKTKEFSLYEELQNFRIKSGAPIILRSDLQGLLWPRIDGTYAYQSTELFVEKHPECDHDGEEEALIYKDKN